MPIECSVEICAPEQERFHALDKVVMRHAFDLQNTLGRFFDERIYQDELALRCGESGIRCLREVELRVCHKTFEKSYYLDLLVEQGSAYELKTVESLANAHQNQLLNYLLLTGTSHGKLINFRPSSVESRFVSTRLSHSDRMSFQLTESEWHRCDANTRLRSALIDLLADWGTHLDINLYREALLHLLDSPESGFFPVIIQVNDRTVGSQKMCLLNPENAWHLTAIKTNWHSHESNIRRLMHHTNLRSIHWINLHQNQVTLKSLKK